VITIIDLIVQFYHGLRSLNETVLEVTLF